MAKELWPLHAAGPRLAHTLTGGPMNPDGHSISPLAASLKVPNSGNTASGQGERAVASSQARRAAAAAAAALWPTRLVYLPKQQLGSVPCMRLTQCWYYPATPNEGLTGGGGAPPNAFARSGGEGQRMLQMHPLHAWPGRASYEGLANLAPGEASQARTPPIRTYHSLPGPTDIALALTSRARSCCLHPMGRRGH